MSYSNDEIQKSSLNVILHYSNTNSLMKAMELKYNYQFFLY